MKKRIMLLLSFFLMFPLVSCQSKKVDENIVIFHQFYDLVSDFNNGSLLYWLQEVEGNLVSTIFKVEIQHDDSIKTMKVENQEGESQVYIKDNGNGTYDQALIVNEQVTITTQLPFSEIEDTIRYDWLMDLSAFNYDYYDGKNGLYTLKSAYYPTNEVEYEVVTNISVLVNELGAFMVIQIKQANAQGIRYLRATWSLTELREVELTFPTA